MSCCCISLLGLPETGTKSFCSKSYYPSPRVCVLRRNGRCVMGFSSNGGKKEGDIPFCFLCPTSLLGKDGGMRWNPQIAYLARLCSPPAIPLLLAAIRPANPCTAPPPLSAAGEFDQTEGGEEAGLPHQFSYVRNLCVACAIEFLRSDCLPAYACIPIRILSVIPRSYRNLLFQLSSPPSLTV